MIQKKKRCSSCGKVGTNWLQVNGGKVICWECNRFTHMMKDLKLQFYEMEVKDEQRKQTNIGK